MKFNLLGPRVHVSFLGLYAVWIFHERGLPLAFNLNFAVSSLPNLHEISKVYY